MDKQSLINRAKYFIKLANEATEGPWSLFTDDSQYPPYTNIVSITKNGTKYVASLPGIDKTNVDVQLMAASIEMAKLLTSFVDLLED